MKCRKCGQVISRDNAKFCAYCGAKLETTRACPHCHFQNVPINATFCPKCGLDFKYYEREKLLHRFDKKPINLCGECLNLNGRPAVDLGLSVLWSTYNVGTQSILSDGLNFSWGDPARETINSLLSNWFKTMPSESDICATRYDMARYKWNAPWQLPQCDHFIELAELCSWEVVNYNGQKVYQVKSCINGNYILMPLCSKLWIGDHAYSGSVHFFDTQSIELCCEGFDIDHRYYVRPVVIK